MNCKPGDIAIIVADHKVHPSSAGRLVDVLYAAPCGEFRLPDGSLTRGRPGNWVIRLHSPLAVFWADGIARMATYGSCPDSKLRPIRNQPGEDEILRIAGKPCDIKTPDLERA